MRSDSRPTCHVSWLVVAGSAALLGCTDPAPAPLPVAAPIVNGTLDTADPAVLFLAFPSHACTGTLVSPRVILTARHCLDGVAQGAATAYISNSSTAGPALKTIAHESSPDEDIGMIALDAPAPKTLKPIPIGRFDLATKIGQPVRIVGFGATEESGAGGGPKREGATYLHSVQGAIMFTGAADSTSWTCYGDSGGPNFMTVDGVEYVIGVTSFGTTQCGMPFDGAVRTDATIAWLDGFLAQYADEVPPSLEITSPAPGATVRPGFAVLANVTDNREILNVQLFVDGELQDGDKFAPFELAALSTLPLGSHTVTVEAVDFGGNYVEQSIDITVEAECSADTDCAEGEVCSDGVCLGDIGASCTTNIDCLGGQCFTPGDGGERFCTKTCAASDECPADFACAEVPLSPLKKCQPADGGGCRIGQGGTMPVTTGLLAALAILLAARRRR